jgi:hypothetical protein
MKLSLPTHLRRKYVLECVLGGFAADGIIVGLYYVAHVCWPTRFAFDYKFDFAILVLTPPLVITVLQLMRGEVVAKADFVKDYVAEFFMNKELNETFYFLVYTYGDKKFAEMEAAYLAAGGYGKIGADPLKIAKVFEPLQEGRAEGCRYYHPDCYQRSMEEKRLDCLLGYFDVLAYYYQNDLIAMEDIAGSLGYHLNILARRDVIKRVRKTYREAVKNPEYVAKNGNIAPFRSLDQFLEDIIKYDKRIGLAKSEDSPNVQGKS